MADDSTPSDPGSADPGGSDTTDQGVDWKSVGEQFSAGAFKNVSADGVSDVVHNAILKAALGLAQLIKEIGGPVAVLVGETIAQSTDALAPTVGKFAAPIVGGMLGASVDPSSFADVNNSGGRDAVAAALVDALIGRIAGAGDGPIEASDAGARNMAAIGLHGAIEGWLVGAVPDLLASLIPIADVRLDGLADLPKEVTRALGLGRLVRSGLTPLVHAVAATPMQWKANTTYRPTKLGAGVAVKQFLRGAWDDAQLSESLARDGYRDEDMDALVNDGKKFLPTNDLGFLVWLTIMSQDEAVQVLADQGYDQQTASKIIIADGLRRLDAIHRSVADAAVAAYVDGRIDAGARDTMLAAALGDSKETAALRDAADAKRQLHQTELSPAEAEACALAGIVPIEDYTAALARAGRSPDAILALELLLRKKIDDKATLDQHRAAATAAREAAAKAKADATAMHAQLVQEAAQKKALGSLNTLERAVIHGLIPIARLEALLSLEFPPDTVAIYVADVEQRAHEYAAAQAKANAATKTATAKRLPMGDLRAAYLDQIISAADVRSQLAAGKLADADIDVILQTWDAALAAKQAAAKLRDDAKQRAAAKRLSLADAETLTVNGHWTIDAFNAFLETLGYNAGDIAHLDLIVQDRIAQHKAAAAAKKTATAAGTAKGLSLAQEQRAVVLGVHTLADFQTWLVNEGYTADAISALVAETQTLLDAAQSARARRSSIATDADGRPASIAEVTRAAQLGLMTPEDYRAALVARGLAPAAIALDLQLLSYELAHAKQPAPAAGSATAAITDAGGSPLVFANKRHVDVTGELEGRGLSLADAENAVKNGLMTYDAFQTWLETNGVNAPDAEILRALLGIKLGAPGS